MRSELLLLSPLTGEETNRGSQSWGPAGAASKQWRPRGSPARRVRPHSFLRPPRPALGAHRAPAESHSEGLAASPGISNTLRASRCPRSSEGPWAPGSWCVQLAAQMEPPVPSQEAHTPGAAAASLQWLGAHPGHKKRRGFCNPWLWKDSRGFLRSAEPLTGQLLTFNCVQHCGVWTAGLGRPPQACLTEGRGGQPGPWLERKPLLWPGSGAPAHPLPLFSQALGPSQLAGRRSLAALGVDPAQMSIPQSCEFSFTGFGHLGGRGLGTAWQARSSPLQAAWAHSSHALPGLRFACPVRSLQAVGGT